MAVIVWFSPVVALVVFFIFFSLLYFGSYSFLSTVLLFCGISSSMDLCLSGNRDINYDDDSQQSTAVLHTWCVY